MLIPYLERGENYIRGCRFVNANITALCTPGTRVVWIKVTNDHFGCHLPDHPIK